MLGGHANSVLKAQRPDGRAADGGQDRAAVRLGLISELEVCSSGI